MDMIEFQETYEQIYKRYYDYQICPFHVRYQREVPDDLASPYKLVEYDMSHSHPLSLKTIKYNDILHFANPAYHRSDGLYYPHAHWKNLYSKNRMFGISEMKLHQSGYSNSFKGIYRTMKVTPFNPDEYGLFKGGGYDSYFKSKTKVKEIKLEDFKPADDII